MRRSVTASALLGLLAAAAWGQTPTAPAPKPAAKAPLWKALLAQDDRPGPAPKAADKTPAPDTLDARIAAALAHDADVQTAKAKIQLAEAEMAKARQQVVERVVACHENEEAASQGIKLAEMKYKLSLEAFQKGQLSKAEVIADQMTLNRFLEPRSKAETELRRLTGRIVAPAPAGAKPAEVKPVPATLEGQIAAALGYDADVQIAAAKIQLAAADLVKARQQVAQKVTALHSGIEDAKRAVQFAEQQYARVAQLFQHARVEAAAADEKRAALESAKSKLDALAGELKLLTGGGPAAAGPSHSLLTPQEALARYLGMANPAANFPYPLEYHGTMTTTFGAATPGRPAGPVPDRIRAALDKKVKLGPKGEKVPFDKAMEVFKKEAGLDVPVRPTPRPMPTIESDGDELPIGAWFQLYQDLGGLQTDGLTFYVREYGLLVANKHTAPPDAPTVTQFWQAKPPAPKGNRTAEVVAPTKFTAEVKYHGRTLNLTDAVGRELLRAALKLAKTYGNPDMHRGRSGEWGDRGPVDYLRFQTPSARDFGLDYEGPLDVQVDLTQFPDQIRTIYVWTSDRTLTYMNFQPDPTKEFATVVANALAAK